MAAVTKRSKVAVVTGSNKGIGLEIVRILGSTKDWRAILCSRDMGRGEAARKSLLEAGVKHVDLVILDISDASSIAAFVENLKSVYGAVDVLVNNAAIAFKAADPTPFREQARPTMATNLIATVALTNALLPLLLKSGDARIINVASQAGSSAYGRMSAQLQRALTSATASQKSIVSLAHAFVDSVEKGTHNATGWPSTCYGTSKALLIAWTRALARDHGGKGIITAASCCPGWCATDMSSHSGKRSAAKGAETPAWLALRSEPLRGGFWFDKEEIGERVFRAPK